MAEISAQYNFFTYGEASVESTELAVLIAHFVTSNESIFKYIETIHFADCISPLLLKTFLIHPSTFLGRAAHKWLD